MFLRATAPNILSLCAYRDPLWSTFIPFVVLPFPFRWQSLQWVLGQANMRTTCAFGPSLPNRASRVASFAYSLRSASLTPITAAQWPQTSNRAPRFARLAIISRVGGFPWKEIAAGKSLRANSGSAHVEKQDDIAAVVERMARQLQCHCHPREGSSLPLVMLNKMTGFLHRLLARSRCAMPNRTPPSESKHRRLQPC